MYVKLWINRAVICFVLFKCSESRCCSVYYVFSDSCCQLRHFLAPWTYCRMTSTFQVMFICNHCPFVKHLKKDIAKVTSFYMEVRTWKNWHNVLLFCLCLWWPLDTMQKGLGAVAISSNSIRTHPQVRNYNRRMSYLSFCYFCSQ